MSNDTFTESKRYKSARLIIIVLCFLFSLVIACCLFFSLDIVSATKEDYKPLYDDFNNITKIIKTNGVNPNDSKLTIIFENEECMIKSTYDNEFNMFSKPYETDKADTIYMAISKFVVYCIFFTVYLSFICQALNWIVFFCVYKIRK